MEENKKIQAELSDAKEQLDHANARYKLLFERNINPIAVTDENFRFTEINAAFCTMLGYSEQELYALSMPEISHKEDGDKSIFLIKQLIKGEIEHFVIGKKYVHKDGSVVFANTAVRALPKKNGKYNGSIASIEELTMEKVKHIENSNDRLKSFAYSISHDLRAPLNNIKSCLDILKHQDLKDPNLDARELLGIIEGSTERMSKMILEVLSNSMLDRSEEVNTVLLIDLNEIMKDVLANLASAISTSNATVHVEQLGSVWGCYSELVQLFQNLVLNSIKYARVGVDPVILISAQPEDSGGRFFVRDNGMGVAQDRVNQIFNEFDRGDQEGDTGYGIGLSTCRKIVQLYGGAICMKSELDEGTEVSFVLRRRGYEPSSDPA